MTFCQPADCGSSLVVRPRFRSSQASCRRSVADGAEAMDPAIHRHLVAGCAGWLSAGCVIRVDWEKAPELCKVGTSAPAES